MQAQHAPRSDRARRRSRAKVDRRVSPRRAETRRKAAPARASAAPSSLASAANRLRATESPFAKAINRLLQQNLPKPVIAQMRCPSLRFEPRAKKSCRPLLEHRPRVWNEAIAVWHLHARKRLRVENHCFVDNIAFRKDESY